MAERVEEMPPRRAGAAKYPWEEWMDGSVWKLTQGEDFPNAARSFRQAVYAAAKIRGGVAECREVRGKNGSADVLYIQFNAPT